jgi:hypothetical protein
LSSSASFFPKRIVKKFKLDSFIRGIRMRYVVIVQIGRNV